MSQTHELWPLILIERRSESCSGEDKGNVDTTVSGVHTHTESVITVLFHTNGLQCRRLWVGLMPCSWFSYSFRRYYREDIGVSAAWTRSSGTAAQRCRGQGKHWPHLTHHRVAQQRQSVSMSAWTHVCWGNYILEKVGICVCLYLVVDHKV